MIYLLIGITILCFTIQNIGFKEYSRLYGNSRAGFFFFNMMYSMAVVFLIPIIFGKIAPQSKITIVVSILFGGVFVLTIFSFTQAVMHGPLSFSTLAQCLGILFPTLAGVLFWDEKLSMINGMGFILLLVMFVILVSGACEERTESQLSGRWLFFSFLSFVGNGTLMVLIKLHQEALPGLEQKEFLFLAFGSAAIVSAIAMFIRLLLSNESIKELLNRKFALVVLIVGLTTVLANNFSLDIADTVPASLQFPLINGGLFMMNTIAATAVYKETLTKRSVTGLAVGLVSLVLLSLK